MTMAVKLSADFQVYLITDRSLFAPDVFLTAVESALKGGIRALQLREKDLDHYALPDLARQMKTLTQKYNASLMINGQAEVAHVVGAEGVHLPENCIASIKEIRKKFPRLVVGVSTHSLEKAREAEVIGADFITFSPIFDTPSKKEYGPPQGLDKLREAVQAVNIPVLALGGITQERITPVLQAGAFGVALISGIWNSGNIEKSVFEYIQHFGGKSV